MTTSVREYIGSRYVPIFGRKNEDSIAWDNTKPYEPLTIVLYQGNSYTSRQYVPVGVEITNQTFWALTGNYNAQVEAYRQEVETYTQAYGDAIDALEDALPIANFSSNNTVKDLINKTVVGFDTVADMKASTILENGMICHTNGFHSSDDGGAAYYKISDSGTANEMDVIACGNLYANLLNVDDSLIPERYGAYGDGEHDDTNVIAYLCDNDIVRIKLRGYYKLTDRITINASSFSLIGNEDYVHSQYVDNENECGFLLNSSDTDNANAGFYIKGKYYTNAYVCLMKLSNFIVRGRDEKGIFLKIQQSGAPSRPCEISNVEATNIDTFLQLRDYEETQADTGIDTLLMQNCRMRHLNYAIDAEGYVYTDPTTQIQYPKSTIGQALIQNNVLEANAKIRIIGIHGNINLLNNMLEGVVGDYEFVVSSQNGSVNLEGNYFEENNGKFIVRGLKNTAGYVQGNLTIKNNTFAKLTTPSKTYSPQIEAYDCCVVFDSYNVDAVFGVYGCLISGVLSNKLTQDSYGVAANVVAGSNGDPKYTLSTTSYQKDMNESVPIYAAGEITFTSSVTGDKWIYGYKTNGKLQFGDDQPIIPYNRGLFFVRHNVVSSETITTTAPISAPWIVSYNANVSGFLANVRSF